MQFVKNDAAWPSGNPCISEPTLDSVKRTMSMDNINLGIMHNTTVPAKRIKTIKPMGQTCKLHIAKFGREVNAEK